MQAIENLELRLTDAQIAAIRQRIARRKRQIKECDGLELGEINGMEDLQSYLAQIDERTHTQRLSSSREFSLQTLSNLGREPLLLFQVSTAKGGTTYEICSASQLRRQSSVLHS
jgi:hypothetical protein